LGAIFCIAPQKLKPLGGAQAHAWQSIASYPLVYAGVWLVYTQFSLYTAELLN